MNRDYDFSKGRRGPVIPSPGKTRITIMLDDDVLEYFRSRAEQAGTGYQTMINATLRSVIDQTSARNEDDELVTVAKLRAILRETWQSR